MGEHYTAAIPRIPNVLEKHFTRVCSRLQAELDGIQETRSRLGHAASRFRCPSMIVHRHQMRHVSVISESIIMPVVSLWPKHLCKVKMLDWRIDLQDGQAVLVDTASKDYSIL